jgi:hypothetical protein
VGGRPFNDLPELCGIVGGDLTLHDVRQALKLRERLRPKTKSFAGVAL